MYNNLVNSAVLSFKTFSIIVSICLIFFRWEDGNYYYTIFFFAGEEAAGRLKDSEFKKELKDAWEAGKKMK